MTNRPTKSKVPILWFTCLIARVVVYRITHSAIALVQQPHWPTWNDCRQSSTLPLRRFWWRYITPCPSDRTWSCWRKEKQIVSTDRKYLLFKDRCNYVYTRRQESLTSFYFNPLKTNRKWKKLSVHPTILTHCRDKWKKLSETARLCFTHIQLLYWYFILIFFLQ